MINRFMWWLWTPVRRFAGWYFWHEPALPLPSWAPPYVLGISLGSWPHKVPKE